MQKHSIRCMSCLRLSKPGNHDQHNSSYHNATHTNSKQENPIPSMASNPTISHVVHNLYQQEPERIAITLLFSNQPDQNITYRRLIAGAAGYAKALSQAGIRPGEVVILILQHGTELIYSFFGAILQGAIPSIMPFLTEKLAPDEYRHSLEALFEITAPAAVITYPEFIEEVRVAAKGKKSIRAILVSNEVTSIADSMIAEFNGQYSSPRDIVLLQHSSGTTGLQKGVALSHEAVFNQLESYSKAIRLSKSDVIVSWLPLYHDMGLVAGFLMPILTQVRLILLSPFDWVRAPFRLMSAISKYKGTLTWQPNFAYNFCAQKIRSRDLEGVDLTSLRAVINCSEPMYWESHQMYLERFQPYGLRADALATSYAMAENVFGVTQGGIEKPVTIDHVNRQALSSQRVAKLSLEGEDALKMLSAGFPIENTQLRIIDSTGIDLPERHIGEIAIQSDCMLSGYYNRPDLTSRAFLDGWYLTGDLGYFANGELYVTGRKKDLIIVGGKNIYPQDLEKLASDVPGVYPGRVVAFGVYNQLLGTEEVVLIAEAQPIDTEARHKIADQIRTHVNRGSDIALRYIKIVDRAWLLKTSSGKIARQANRDKYLQEERHV